MKNKEKRHTQPDPAVACPGYEEIAHTADLALRIRGEDLKALMINAARGVTALMATGPLHEGASVDHSLSVEAIDAESLLVEWLSELVFLAESEGILFQTFTIQEISETCLTAILHGGTTGRLKRIIKAVTFHNLEIDQTPGGLAATVVFDV